MKINWKLILKVVTGFFVVPIAVIAGTTWPWWQKTSLPMKILTGIFVLPITGIAYMCSFWWNKQ